MATGQMSELLIGESRWHVHHGDCIPHMEIVMPESSVDFSVFSPPFPSLYAYTASESDIGNVDAMGDEAKVHLGFFFKRLARVLKPGRVAIVHVAQIPRMKRTGGVGLCDFRGLNIRIGERAGLVYEYDWLIPKNPQAQAIRTKSRNLQFSGLETDRANSRGALGDYLIKFRKPGENAVAIESENQVSRNNWIEWAEASWSGIRETNTLNTLEAKGENDTKHICPLQLDVIERCVRLYSNPDEIVFSPFTGVGSEGYISIKLGRRFYGCELKQEYHKVACRNLAKIQASSEKQAAATLF